MVRINKWIIVGGILLFCVATVAAGLGVYFGTRCSNSSSSNGSTVSPTPPTTAPPNLRLPQNLKPVKYILSVKTYIPSPDNVVNFDSNQTFTFDGNVSIVMSCVVDASVIVMQMSNINISNYALKTVNNNGTETDLSFAKDFTYDDYSEEVTFYPKNTLTSGSIYILDIQYVGELSDDLRGFYRSSYEENGKLK